MLNLSCRLSARSVSCQPCISCVSCCSFALLRILLLPHCPSFSYLCFFYICATVPLCHRLVCSFTHACLCTISSYAADLSGYFSKSHVMSSTRVAGVLQFGARKSVNVHVSFCAFFVVFSVGFLDCRISCPFFISLPLRLVLSAGIIICALCLCFVLLCIFVWVHVVHAPPSHYSLAASEYPCAFRGIMHACPLLVWSGIVLTQQTVLCVPGRWMNRDETQGGKDDRKRKGPESWSPRETTLLNNFV